jgi:hypothetical protein
MALRYVGGDGQQGPINSTLPCPLLVGVEDSTGRPAPNVKVTFRANVEGDVVFEWANPANNRSHQIEIVTTAEGLAETGWQFGSTAGCHDVDAFFSDNPAEHLRVKFEADVPAAFLTLRYVGGDGQQGEAWNDLASFHETSTLPCPLIVGVEDSVGHPVAGVPITFNAERTDLNDLVYDLSNPGTKASQINMQTDQNGLAQVGWQLGRVPGCHRVEAFLTSEPGPHLGVKFEANAMGSVYGATLPRVAGICAGPGGSSSLTNGGTLNRSDFNSGLCVDFTEDMAGQRNGVGSNVGGPDLSTFIVSVDIAEGSEAIRAQWHKTIILEGTVTLTTGYGEWRRYQFVPSPPLTREALALWIIDEQGWSDPKATAVRCRARLIGDSILNAAGTHRLDGNILGPTFGPFGNGFPSGDGIEGGDFEFWFWLSQ